MASLSTDRGGLRRIQYHDRDGKRQAIRLGKIPKKRATTIRDHVEHLIAGTRGYPIPETTQDWLGEQDDTLRKRLAELGLAAPKVAPCVVTLGMLVEIFQDRPRWRLIAERTRENYQAGFDRLLGKLGTTTRVEAITALAVEDFRGYMLEAKPRGAGLSRATANQVCRTSNMLFRFAVRSGLIGRNPFEGIEQGSVATTRRAFVDASTVYKLCDALRDSQWRLLVALARWGGLRVPSEPMQLRWADIDREHNRILVRCPKLSQYEGKDVRVIPLFPELEPFIQDAFDDAEPGEELVLPFLRKVCRVTPSTEVRKTLDRLGIPKWPRVFHNLRSTRQTELEEQFPSHVVAGWLGNSTVVAAKHYLQITPDHFDRATNEAAHKAAQTASARERQARPKPWARMPKPAELPSVSSGGESVRGG